ncbi:hypothetical protein COU20_03615 [Candidatus Kaiserbacteria bacterium CG10_big_fil_rev_8_21_14_0_10_59_10]|uniref:Uncharacterized protein n=1 Tax=Candidatus Kaiserbacteria bacterium CG10_big_fil_rev_8_21_14_0_10_59_10 TaxID=1974612 RepID=A0A2H0U731_9BACT|nr:MAG: hypothetical protein COU20_03615 [Candidatus Kaiserbacteria bacterium CG10_big_fil_rev_8_21_14_0_10_59_10]
MSEVFLRVMWLALIAGALAYAAYLFLGSTILAQAEDSLAHVIVRDTIEDGVHRLSGMVMVPSDCHGISVRVHQSDASEYALSISTWIDPTRVCEPEPTARAFRVVTFAPPVGTAFTATLDGSPIPLTVLTHHIRSHDR